MHRQIVSILIILLCLPTFSYTLTEEQENADMARRMGYHTYAVDTTRVNTLTLDVEALAFFKDNEFDGNVQCGYSLPGVKVRPSLAYTPIKEIKLELGLHAMFYSGANKYPCYVYHDVSTWKGDQYQRGAHMLPFFRASAGFENVTVVVGDIYGGATHETIEPLYNSELILTEDPEMGCQLFFDTPRWHSDLWLNWQSYIFKESNHQEAFTFGWNQRIELFKRHYEGKSHKLNLPIQLLVQHRGGEQLKTNVGVQTIANGALGLSYEYRTMSNKIFSGVQAEAMALYCYQQKGTLWPFGHGGAMWVKGSVDLIRDLRITAGLFSTRKFCSLYGNPYFGTLSTKYPGGMFSSVTTGLLAIEYSRTFARNYTIGTHLKAYLTSTGTLEIPQEDNSTLMINGGFGVPFSFGVYFRCSPSFILKRF